MKAKRAFRRTPELERPRTYPVVRVSSEYFMRSIDLLADVQPGNLVASLIFVTLWAEQLTTRRYKAIPIRELARRLGVPYETARRNAALLVHQNLCAATEHGLVVPGAVLRRPRYRRVVRLMHANIMRLLAELARIGVLKGAIELRHAVRRSELGRRQTAFARAGIRSWLRGITNAADGVGGDILRGFVVAAIWTANVKHFTTTSTGGPAAMLRDDDRRPVTVMAIANSLRLPYETVRRYINDLVAEDICRRIGREGVIVTTAYIYTIQSISLKTVGLVADLVADLRRAGLRASLSTSLLAELGR